MDHYSQIIISLTLYKIVSLIVGTTFAFMGYKLFVSGITGNAGELVTEGKGMKINLKKAAPGTFFAMFGTIIVSVTLYKGLEFKSHSLPTATTNANSAYQILVTKENRDELPDESPF